MKKNFKLVLALVLAMMMIVANISAMAADPDVSNPGAPYAGDTHSDNTWTGTADASISITGLAEGDTVKFYRVLGYDQNAYYTVANATEMTTNAGDWAAMSWKVVSPFNTAPNAITKAEFQAILTTGITDVLAGKIAKNATGTPTFTALTVADGATSVTQSNPGPGLYVAIIVPADPGVMYNPIFVASDYYTSDPDDLSSTWEPVETPLSYSNGAMAKKAPLIITKDAEEHAEATNETNGAKAVGVGDVVDFTVKTTIPEFADNYTKPLFVITDALSAGLTLDTTSIKVYPATVSGTTWTKGNEITATEGNTKTFTIPAANLTESGYKIVFDPEYLLGLDAAQPIIVEYSATVNQQAVSNVKEEDNTVTLEYSHEPSVDDEGEGKKIRDKTHHYTFTIDGYVWGDTSYHGTEVVKIGLDKDGKEITQTKELDNGYEVGALQGAEFKLYTDAECSTEYAKGAYAAATATANGNKILSDANGRLYINGQEGISGLDAGTYYLKEELAPAGYIKQQAPVKIEIIPTYFTSFTFTDSDGFELTCDDVLEKYEVKIDNERTAEYTLTYPAPVNGVYSTDVATGVHAATDSTEKGDIVIGNSGPIVDTTDPNYQATDDDGKIKNTRGVELPSTGGIGTTIFYVGGSILVLAAAILLITKRRMSSND